MISSDGVLKRMNFEANRREPTQKEYHTGLRAAGRESAARQCVVNDKDAGKRRCVAPRNGDGNESRSPSENKMHGGRHEEEGVVGQFEFRFTGKGPNMSLKNRTNSASETIAIHHGLSIIGNNNISSHAHQGTRDHRLLPDFVGFAWSSMQGKEYAPIAVRFKG